MIRYILLAAAALAPLAAQAQPAPPQVPIPQSLAQSLFAYVQQGCGLSAQATEAMQEPQRLAAAVATAKAEQKAADAATPATTPAAKAP